MAVKGSSMLASSLLGCSPVASPSPGSELIWEKGQQACLISGSTPKPVIVMEDIEDGRMTAMVKMPDGKIEFVPSEWLVDSSECQ